MGPIHLRRATSTTHLHGAEELEVCLLESGCINFRHAVDRDWRADTQTSIYREIEKN